MNFPELIDQFAAVNNVSKTVAKEHLRSAFGLVKEAVQKGNAVAIPDFGKFSKVTKPARNGRNPATGAPVAIPEKDIVKFKASSVFLG